MGRKIYICKRNKQSLAAALEEAATMDISEVVQGISKRLAGIITEDMLPCTYEEPDPEPIQKPTPIADEIANIKARIAKIEEGGLTDAGLN